MKQRTSGAGNRPDNFVIITDRVSPLQKQLLDHKILLANTPADPQDQESTSRAFRKLRLLESLVEDEQAQIPHYAVRRLVDLDELDLDSEEGTGLQAKDYGSNGSAAVARPAVQSCGLNDSLGDLLEERRDMIAQAGKCVAGIWLCKQILTSILPMLLKATHILVKNSAATHRRRIASIIVAVSLEAITTAIVYTLIRYVIH